MTRRAAAGASSRRRETLRASAKIPVGYRTVLRGDLAAEFDTRPESQLPDVSPGRWAALDIGMFARILDGLDRL